MVDREIAHRPVIGEEHNLQFLDAAILRQQDQMAHERRADAFALPRPLDAERGLRSRRLARAPAQRMQFGERAQFTVDEIAHRARIAGHHAGGMAGQRAIRHHAAEAHESAQRIEAQQMRQDQLAFRRNQLADMAGHAFSAMRRRRARGHWLGGGLGRRSVHGQCHRLGLGGTAVLYCGATQICAPHKETTPASAWLACDTSEAALAGDRREQMINLHRKRERDHR